MLPADTSSRAAVCRPAFPRLLRDARAIAAVQDVRVIVDTSWPPLEAAIAEGVYLIKPSPDELAELVGADRTLGPGEQLEAARDIVDDGAPRSSP